jgi:hypothetical protein
MIVSHTGYNKFIRADCDYPWLYNTITFYYTWSMVILFSHFYYQTYVAPRRRQQAAKKLAAKSEVPVTPAASHSDVAYTNGYLADSANDPLSLAAERYELRSRKKVETNGSVPNSPLEH